MLAYMESFNGSKKIGTIRHDDAYVNNGTLGAIDESLAYIEESSTDISLRWDDAALADIRTRETVGMVGEYRCVAISEDEADRIFAAAGVSTSKAAEAEGEELEAIIDLCERQTDLPTREEATRRMTEYNNATNEGGDGYVPHIYSKEELLMTIKAMRNKVIREGGAYDTKKYRYIIDARDGKLKRVELSKLDTTAMLDKNVWEVVG